VRNQSTLRWGIERLENHGVKQQVFVPYATLIRLRYSNLYKYNSMELGLPIHGRSSIRQSCLRRVLSSPTHPVFISIDVPIGVHSFCYYKFSIVFIVCSSNVGQA
jgi:hypothetical protein